MPKADTYSSLVLESDGTKFVTTGSFNLTIAKPVMNSLLTSSTYTINLSDVSTTDKNQMITVYAMVAPRDLSTSNITVTVHGAGQTTYVQNVTGKNFEAGKAYNFSIESFPSGTNASGENVSWVEPIDPYNGHEYVEIGGKKWATMNVGATTIAGSYNTCCGDYFAWGEALPRYTSINRNNKTASFVWNSEHLQGYTSNDVPAFTNSVLDATHDAATKNWGAGWQTPTKEDFIALYEACGGTGDSYYNGSGLRKGTAYTTDKGIFWCDDFDGVAGLLFCDGTNRLFFPSAGNVTNMELCRVGDAAWNCYWSATKNSNNVAHVLQFDNQVSRGGGIYPRAMQYTHIGYPVRAVCK